MPVEGILAQGAALVGMAPYAEQEQHRDTQGPGRPMENGEALQEGR